MRAVTVRAVMSVKYHFEKQLLNKRKQFSNRKNAGKKFRLRVVMKKQSGGKHKRKTKQKANMNIAAGQQNTGI